VFGDFSKWLFWRDLSDYSILWSVHGMQEVVGSNPIGSIDLSFYHQKACEKSFPRHSSRQMLCYAYNFILEINIKLGNKPASNVIILGDLLATIQD